MSSLFVYQLPTADIFVLVYTFLTSGFKHLQLRCQAIVAVLMMTTEKHHEDFLEMSRGELEYFLKVRGLRITGKNVDLAARALVAYENRIPIKKLSFNFRKVFDKNTRRCWIAKIHQIPLQ